MASMATAGDAATRSPSSGSSIRLTDLPPELVELVAYNLQDTASIKSSRLVCRAMNTLVERVFIAQCINVPKVYVDKTGLTNLEQLAKSRWGRLIYGLSLRARPDLSDFLSRDLEEALEVVGRGNPWAAGHTAVVPLADALKLLPQLSSIEIRLHLEPDHDDDEDMEFFATVVLSALNFSRVSLKRLSFGSSRAIVNQYETLPVTFFSLPDSVRSGLPHLMANLECLELTLNDKWDCHGGFMSEDLALFINSAVSLETLHISYDDMSSISDDIELAVEDFFDELSLPKLKNLRLCTMQIQIEDLAALLKAHAKTLRALQLANISILDSTPSHDFHLHEYITTGCGLSALTQLSFTYIQLNGLSVMFNTDECDQCGSETPCCYLDSGEPHCPAVTLKAEGTGCVSAIKGARLVDIEAYLQDDL